MVVGFSINLKSFLGLLEYANFQWVEFLKKKLTKLCIWMNIICYVIFC
jgi:hypothetical protein